MSKFEIISQSKIKSEAQFNGQSAHNKREILAANIRQSATHKNIILMPYIYSNFQEFIKSKKQMIFEKNKINGTKNRMLRNKKNKKTGETELPSMCQEFIFTHSPGAMNEEASIRFLRLANDFLLDWFKGLEVLGSVIHLDETTPHLHFDITYFDLDRGKFCQSELQKKGLTDINHIRTAWHLKLQNSEFTSMKMQDGSVISERKHKTKLSKTIRDLEQDIKILEDANERLIEDNIVNAIIQGNHKGDKEALSKANHTIEQKDYKIANLEQKISMLEKMKNIFYKATKLIGIKSSQLSAIEEELDKYIESKPKTIEELQIEKEILSSKLREGTDENLNAIPNQITNINNCINKIRKLETIRNKEQRYNK